MRKGDQLCRLHGKLTRWLVDVACVLEHRCAAWRTTITRRSVLRMTLHRKKLK